MQVTERTDAGELTAAQGLDIEFRDVTFGYRDDQDILQVRRGLSALGERYLAGSLTDQCSPLFKRVCSGHTGCMIHPVATVNLA